MFKISLCAFLVLATSPAFAQHAHHHSDGPTEVGQSAFAAISEIVEILQNDPETDWNKVNISALQNHLVDMDLVTTRTKVTVETNNKTVAITVSSQGEAVGAIQRMTTAHAPMLAAETGWEVDVDQTTSGAVLRIAVSSENELARVTGLGFYGLMTIGAHHQAHHLQIALGDDPHH
jgi:predicted transcriptional regulator